MHRTKQRLYSITSSASASIVAGNIEPSRERRRELILPSEGLDQNAGLGHFTGVALAPFAKP
jgi:hypothetical protein